MSTPYPAVPHLTPGPPPGVVDDSPLPGASFEESVRRLFRRATVFTGRASLSEYWWVVLLHLLVLMTLAVVAVGAAVLGEAVRPSTELPPGAMPGAVLGILVVAALGVVYWLLTVVPTVALRTRRLHDAGFSGWYQLLLLVSFAEVVVLAFTLMPSNPQGRRYDRTATAPAPGYGGPWAAPARGDEIR